jgi:hypothetical protein
LTATGIWSHKFGNHPIIIFTLRKRTMKKSFKALRKLFRRGGARANPVDSTDKGDSDDDTAELYELLMDDDYDPEQLVDIPELSVDSMGHVLDFVGDHGTWNEVSILHKALLQHSKRLSGPWPDDYALFGNGYEKPGFEQVVFSLDSRFLCKVSQPIRGDGWNDDANEIKISIASSKQGLLEVNHIDVDRPKYWDIEKLIYPPSTVTSPILSSERISLLLPMTSWMINLTLILLDLWT